MIWEIIYGIDRKEKIVADNVNDACKQADDGIKEGERIVSVRVKR